mmetsp:Transcript_66143/g.187657  ORF Transcript_66143/g.187657 Transcript_66143/m.187657 type:complete len:229 (+) Transcript_66143:542-1228(+)
MGHGPQIGATTRPSWCLMSKTRDTVCSRKCTTSRLSTLDSRSVPLHLSCPARSITMSCCGFPSTGFEMFLSDTRLLWLSAWMQKVDSYSVMMATSPCLMFWPCWRTRSKRGMAAFLARGSNGWSVRGPVQASTMPESGSTQHRRTAAGVDLRDFAERCSRARRKISMPCVVTTARSALPGCCGGGSQKKASTSRPSARLHLQTRGTGSRAGGIVSRQPIFDLPHRKAK